MLQRPNAKTIFKQPLSSISENDYIYHLPNQKISYVINYKTRQLTILNRDNLSDPIFSFALSREHSRLVNVFPNGSVLLYLYNDSFDDNLQNMGYYLARTKPLLENMNVSSLKDCISDTCILFSIHVKNTSYIRINENEHENNYNVCVIDDNTFFTVDNGNGYLETRNRNNYIEVYHCENRNIRRSIPTVECLSDFQFEPRSQISHLIPLEKNLFCYSNENKDLFNIVIFEFNLNQDKVKELQLISLKKSSDCEKIRYIPLPNGELLIYGLDNNEARIYQPRNGKIIQSWNWPELIITGVCNILPFQDSNHILLHHTILQTIFLFNIKECTLKNIPLPPDIKISLNSKPKILSNGQVLVPVIDQDLNPTILPLYLPETLSTYLATPTALFMHSVFNLLNKPGDNLDSNEISSRPKKRRRLGE